MEVTGKKSALLREISVGTGATPPGSIADARMQTSRFEHSRHLMIDCVNKCKSNFNPINVLTVTFSFHMKRF